MPCQGLLDQNHTEFTSAQQQHIEQLPPQSAAGHASDMTIASTPPSHSPASPSASHRDSLPRAFYDLPAESTAYVNRRVHYGAGQFCGKVIRIELHELQKAELGRKYARVDRRPLDPPPVVQMRIYESTDPDSGREVEREIANYDSIEVHGFIGMVDLFPVPRTERVRRKGQKKSQQPLSPSPVRPGSIPPPQYQPSVETHDLATPHQVKHDPDPGSNTPQSPIPGPSNDDPDSSDVVHHVDGYPIKESSKMTHALVGATFVEPVAIDWQGQKSLMFVFADLAVKTEGDFILRYRVFNIFSTPIGHLERIIQAECYGGVFRVYSTKEFPGLHASTELTKQLARWGVRLNIREAERKRRRRGDSGSQSPAAASSSIAGPLLPLPPPPAPEESMVVQSDTSPASYGEDDAAETIQSEEPTSMPSRKRPRLLSSEHQHVDDD